MRNLLNFTSTSSNNYLRFQMGDVPYTLRDLFSYFYKDFIEKFNFIGDFNKTLSRCLSIIENNHTEVQPRDLFDYSVYLKTNNPFLVAKDGVFVRKYDKEREKMRDTYWDVYVCQASYSELQLSYIGERLFEMAFPCIKDEKVFYKESVTYPDCIWNINKDTPVADLDDILNHQFDFDHHLTLGELINVVLHPETIAKKKPKSLFSIFGNGHIFLSITPDKDTCDKGHKSIMFCSEDFINRDWTAVIERKCGVTWRDEKWLNSCNKDVIGSGNPTIIDKIYTLIFNEATRVDAC